MHLSPQEASVIDEVCERLNMRPGAWIGEIAVRYAKGQLDPLPADWQDLIKVCVEFRADVAKGFNLANQVAGHANATGEFTEHAGRLLAVADRILSRVDEATAEAVERAGRDR